MAAKTAELQVTSAPPPFVDLAFTARTSEVHVRLDLVEARVELTVEDSLPLSVYASWSLISHPKEAPWREESAPQNGSFSFTIDEMEAFAIALNKAFEQATWRAKSESGHVKGVKSA